MKGPAAPLLARWDALAGGTRTAIRDAAGAHAYAGIARRAKHVAAALLSGDLRPGDRVALLCAPGADFVTALFGVLRAGGCAVILSPLHPPPESGWFCEDAHVRTIVVTEDLADAARGFSGSRTLSTVTSLATHPMALEAAVPAEAALQLYTSGTTGKPKGAVHHAREPRRAAASSSAQRGASARDDTLLHALPLHHMHGLAIALLTALGAGATTRMLTTLRRRRRSGRRWRTATVFMGVPDHVRRLFARLRRRRRGDARALVGARARAPPRDERQRGARR